MLRINYKGSGHMSMFRIFNLYFIIYISIQRQIIFCYSTCILFLLRLYVVPWWLCFKSLNVWYRSVSIPSRLYWWCHRFVTMQRSHERVHLHLFLLEHGNMVRFWMFSIKVSIALVLLNLVKKRFVSQILC